MAALAVDFQDMEVKGEMAQNIAAGDVIASDIIYKNSFVAFAAAGGISPVIGDLIFAGVAMEQQDNASGALGDKVVRYLKGGRVRIRGGATMARTDEGVPIYSATDNPADLTLTSTGATQIGIITRFYSANDYEIELNDNRL